MDFSSPEFTFLNDTKFSEAATKHGLNVVQVQALTVAAVKAKARAYCPYSVFRVGAALLTKSSLPVSNIAEAPSPSTPPSLPINLGAISGSDIRYGNGGASLGHGQIIVGANIENCSYPVGTCAERAAFATALTMGHLPAGRTLRIPAGGSASEAEVEVQGEGIAAVAVSADTDEPCSPCGMCRQFMREFLPPDTPIFMVARQGNWVVKTMGELLPMSFGASDLKAGQGR